MAKGPRGEKRLANAVGLAVHVARIATSEIEDTPDADDGKALGKKGEAARAAAKL